MPAAPSDRPLTVRYSTRNVCTNAPSWLIRTPPRRYLTGAGVSLRMANTPSGASAFVALTVFPRFLSARSRKCRAGNGFGDLVGDQRGGAEPVAATGRARPDRRADAGQDRAAGAGVDEIVAVPHRGHGVA